MNFLSPDLQPMIVDANGVGVPFAKIYAYYHLTTDNAPTYQKEGGSQNTNPLICNSNGTYEMWLDPTIAYDFDVKTSSGANLFTRENIMTGGSGGSSPVGQYILKQTALGVDQQIETTLVSSKTSSGSGITWKGTIEDRSGVTEIKNKVTGAFNDLGVTLPIKGEVVIDGNNSGAVDSLIEVINNSDHALRPIVKIEEIIRSKTPTTENDLTITKEYDGALSTFKMYDSVYGSSDPFAHLSDIVGTPVGGSNKSIQFNDLGSLGGSTTTYDKVSKVTKFPDVVTIKDTTYVDTYAEFVSACGDANVLEIYLTNSIAIPSGATITFNNTKSIIGQSFLYLQGSGNRTLAGNFKCYAPILIDAGVSVSLTIGGNSFCRQIIRFNGTDSTLTIAGSTLNWEWLSKFTNTSGSVASGGITMAGTNSNMWWVDAPAQTPPQTATIQLSKPGSITANTVISVPTDGNTWFGGANMGYYTGTLKTFKLTNVNVTLLRYVTNSVGSIQMRLAWVNPAQSVNYNAGTGTTIATWTSTIPNTSGADNYYFGFVQNVNTSIPLGAVVFCECTNRTATSIDGIAVLLNFLEI